MIDLRSDTVTTPTEAMREAMARAMVGDDVYGDDPTVNELEARTAEILGKQTAVFVPTGTMSNQIGVRCQTEPGDLVLIDVNAHLVMNEGGGGAAISGVTMRPLRGALGIFTADDVTEAVGQPHSFNPTTLGPPPRLLCVENTHNAGGGTVWPVEALQAVCEAGREHGLPLHLDGARLWHASAASGVPERDYAEPFDTVNVCFSKGLGAPVGSALAGPRAVIDRARRFKQQLGGGFRQAGILAAGALHALENHREERAETWLLEREDQYNLILSLAYGRVGRGDRDSETFFGTVEHRGSVVGCAIRTPPYKVLITDLPAASARAVARSLSTLYEEIRPVLGPAEATKAVAVAWVAERGGGWRPGLAQRIYRLDAVTPPEGVPGALREATTDDIGLAVEWGEGFARDAGVQFATKRDAVERWIERRSLFMWEDGQPRSITVAQGRTPNGIRVGYVYTPPESRGRGYASACVAEVSRRMLDTGVSFCVLYTDLSNPTSNAIYQRLGYDAIADVRDFDLSRIASRAWE